MQRGKTADLLLLDADPLADIHNTTKIDAVILGGRLLSRAVLDGLLADAEAKGRTKNLAPILAATLAKQGTVEALQQYRDLKTTKSDEYYFAPEVLGTLEFQLLDSKKTKELIEVCKLNVEAYPAEWSVYNDLGDAYAANGDKALAIEAYRKSLALFSGNVNATEQIRKLSAETVPK